MQKITKKNLYYYVYNHISYFIPLLICIFIFYLNLDLINSNTYNMKLYALLLINIMCLFIIIFLFEYSKCEIDLSQNQITIYHYTFYHWQKTVISITSSSHFYIGISIHDGKSYAQLFFSYNNTESFKQPINYIKYADVNESERIKDELNTILKWSPKIEQSINKW